VHRGRRTRGGHRRPRERRERAIERALDVVVLSDLRLDVLFFFIVKTRDDASCTR
jgi:hypothetical protein